MIVTLLDDGHKLIGFQLTAIDLARWQALVAASERCTFPGAYDEITKRFAMTQEGVIDPRLQTFEQKLARDADWYFADAMADMHRATAKIRAFRLRAARRGWTVVTTDSVWA